MRVRAVEDVELLLDNLKLVFRRLATLPTSTEVRALCNQALRCEETLKSWTVAPPESETDRDRLRQRILGLHVGVSRLHRHD